MICTKKPGRPAGDKRQALFQWVTAHGRFTMGQLLRGTGWTMKEADNTIQRALAAKQIKVVDKVEQPGCKRKVALYAPACLMGSETLNAAMASWAR